MHPVVNIEDPVGKVVGKRANLSERNYIEFLRQYFAAKGIVPPAP